ncbi:MAG: hypothetical protein GQE15_40120 [Archangiaceae bacterium]|nr:hypothetical protein [Archangiaceae bacterium]
MGLMLKAPVAHDGYGRVAKRLLWWGLVLTVPAAVCMAPSLGLCERDQVSRRSARHELLTINDALNAYRSQNGSWPSEADWAERLVAARLLERAPLDPWGNPYRYRLESADGGEQRPVVSSLGADGELETADDLRHRGSWP